jgi:hypothetical protein
VGQPENEITKWKDNIKIDHREIGCGGRLDSSGSGWGPVEDL